MPAADYVLVEVSDTGTGIASEIIDKIFEPFFSTKEVGKGTGLGLSTVYGIVKQTGGFIYAEFEARRGTTFRIFLPRYHAGRRGVRGRRSAGARRCADGGRAGRARRRRSDRPGHDPAGRGRRGPARAQRPRARPRAATPCWRPSNGVEAIEVLDKHGHVDLVVSDVVMPEMDGPTLLKELRRRDPQVKIIFVSGYAEEAFAKNLPSDEQGTPQYAFLAKPFTLKQLIAVVKQTMAG